MSPDTPQPFSPRVSPFAADRVPEVEPASPERALAYFNSRLELETDCWDVHHDLTTKGPRFVLLDVRSREAYDRGHVPGAVSLPHGEIDETTVARWPVTTLFVVYGDGVHCNAADKAGVRLARLGRRVKKMIGGIDGWVRQQFEITTEPARIGT